MSNNEAVLTLLDHVYACEPDIDHVYAERIAGLLEKIDDQIIHAMIEDHLSDDEAEYQIADAVEGLRCTALALRFENKTPLKLSTTATTDCLPNEKVSNIK